MKVVLFCGGQGMRMREYSEDLPKPMVPIGYRPILWHLMRTTPTTGTRNSSCASGYRGDVIKNYFLQLRRVRVERLRPVGGRPQGRAAHASDIEDWKITFVDTGLNSNIGQRLARRAQVRAATTRMFLANYADGLTDLPLDDAVSTTSRRADKIASFLGVKPTPASTSSRRTTTAR